MNRKKSLVGIGLTAALMALTGWLLFRDQPSPGCSTPWGQLRPGWLLLGLALMLAFVGCEATCSHLILGRLGHRAPLRRCLGYSFVGFYVSSITPSATGGQPAQVYYMSRDGVPAAHGALNMMLIAACYQVVVIGYALAVALLRFDLVANLGGGLGLLLLFGAGGQRRADGGDALPHVPAQCGQKAHWRRTEPAGARPSGPPPGGGQGEAGEADGGVPPGGGLRQAQPRPGACSAGPHLLPAHRPVFRPAGGVPRFRPDRAAGRWTSSAPRPWSPWAVASLPCPGGGRLRGRLCGSHGSSSLAPDW